MEIAGLALGAPGVVALLIQTSLSGYQAFLVVKDLNKNFEEYHHQFSVEQKRLKDWVKKLKDRAGEDYCNEKLLLAFNGDEERLALVERTLTKIAYLFADVRNLDKLYGIKAVLSDTDPVPSIPQRPHKSRFRQIFSRSSPKASTTVNAEPAETSLSVATNLRIDLAFGEEYIATLPIAEKFNYVVSSYAK
jgi:predicted ATP-binding protein involved in virulence